MRPPRSIVSSKRVAPMIGAALAAWASGCAFLLNSDSLGTTTQLDASPETSRTAREGGAADTRKTSPEAADDATRSRPESGTDAPLPPVDAGRDAAKALDAAREAHDSGVPPPAASASYLTNTFSSTFAQGKIDVANSQARGFDWYLGQFFGQTASQASALTFGPDGGVTITNGQIGSAGPDDIASSWVGRAFGGGAYFEAVLSFVPGDAGATGFPTWWAMSLEHLASLPSEQWSGQDAGYDHFVEIDLFKYDIPQAPLAYGGAMVDFYGVIGQTCTNYCMANNVDGTTMFTNDIIHTPSGTDFTHDHTFGFLWVPATGSSSGAATYYFDGKLTSDVVTWSKFDEADVPPPGMTPWTFGILDQQHLSIMLSTGNEPMTVKSVNVWQASSAENLSQ